VGAGSGKCTAGRSTRNFRDCHLNAIADWADDTNTVLRVATGSHRRCEHGFTIIDNGTA